MLMEALPCETLSQFSTIVSPRPSKSLILIIILLASVVREDRHTQVNSKGTRRVDDEEKSVAMNTFLLVNR